MLNAQAFRIGQLIAAGNDPLTVAERFGVPAREVVELMAGYVQPVYPPGHVPVVVSLASKHRTKIAVEAMRRGIEMPDLCGLALSNVARDRLFAAVIEG